VRRKEGRKREGGYGVNEYKGMRIGKSGEMRKGKRVEMVKGEVR